MLIEEIENNRFNLINFYEMHEGYCRHMMLICFPFAWMWMLWETFQGVLLLSVCFLPIFFFGYKVVTSRQRWQQSLCCIRVAIEEQYYLLFPIFLVLAWRFGKNKSVLDIAAKLSFK